MKSKPMHSAAGPMAAMLATLLILACSSTRAFGRYQSRPLDSLWAQATAHENVFNETQALSLYLEVLQYQPDHAKALVKASRLCSRIGGRQEGAAKKKSLVLTARLFAIRALALDSSNMEARFQFVVALALLSEMAQGPNEKLKHARIIREETLRVLKADPGHAAAHYVMGKWHHGLSRLSWFEKLVVETLFGGVPPGASSTEALRSFQKAIELRPDYILFYYGLACMYCDIHEYSEATKLLEKALKIPIGEPDDLIRKKNCKTLLDRLKSI